MQTALLEVADLLSPLSASGVEKMLLRQPGVHHVAVNPVDGTALVHYDETRTPRERLADTVRACGHHCRGHRAPRHLCAGEGAPEPMAGRAPVAAPVGAPHAA